ncbi:MAG: galactokinase, partial [Rhodothermia bacterium]
WSEHAGERAGIPLPPPIVKNRTKNGDAVPNWVLYASGMAWALGQAGHGCTGARLAVCSSLPVGAGVSSSAAFEIAVGTALAVAAPAIVASTTAAPASAATATAGPASAAPATDASATDAPATIPGTHFDPREMALLAHKSDHEFVGIPSGIMDQFASACCRQDHALFLDCRDTSFEHVPLGTETAFVVIGTGKRRELVTGEYAERVASCRRAVDVLKTAFPEITSLRDSSRSQLEDVKYLLDGRTYRRARHVVSEMARPSHMVAAFADRDWQRAGQLMYESHESLAADYDVSCAELDTAVEIASKHTDCYGARLTGAGFGGCAIALCARPAVDDVAVHIEERYRREFGKGKAYGVRASSGVRVVL